MRKNRFILRMAGKSRKLSLVKYLFFGLLVVCFSVVTILLYISDTSMSENEDAGDVNYVRFYPSEFSEDMLDPHFEDCFFSFISQSSNDSDSSFSELSASHSNYSLNSSTEKAKLHPLMRTFLQFSELSHQMKMKTVIIEPSLLFCILSPTFKSLLIKRNYTAEKRAPERVLTVGIFQEEAAILAKEDVQAQLLKKGFDIEIVKRGLPSASRINSSSSLNNSLHTSHVFLQKGKWTLHLVVFRERKSFLWHSALSSKVDFETPSKEALLFADFDAAFENFSAIPLAFKDIRLKYLNIPSHPTYFLHQIATSKFLECNKTVVESFMKKLSSNLIKYHEYSNLLPEQFNQRLSITLEELKSKLNPLLIDFWVWSGTLLGLHRQCDVIPYTSDADFATWATDDNDVEQLIRAMKQNEHLILRQKLGMAQEGLELKFKCHGLSVDFFFVYKEENGTWYAGHNHRNSYYFKYHHPNFSLCSAELLGNKVLTPCDPENVISAEYGSNWMQPISSWSYEHSIYNRGPNIFWERSLLKKVYSNF